MEIALRFARRAHDAVAFEEAARIAREALDIADGDPGVRNETMAELLFTRGRSLGGLDRWEEARVALTSAYDRFEALNNGGRMVDVAIAPVRTELIGSRELIDRALTFAEGADRGRLLCQLGQYLKTWGGATDDPSVSADWEGARAVYEEAIELARQFGDRRTEMLSMGRLGHMLVEFEDISGMDLLEEASSIAVELHDVRAEFRFTEALVWWYFWVTHPPADTIHEAICRLVENSSRRRSREDTGRALGVRGSYLTCLGRLSEALVDLEQAVRLTSNAWRVMVDAVLLLTGDDDVGVRERMRVDGPLKTGENWRGPVRCIMAAINRGWSDLIPPLERVEKLANDLSRPVVRSWIPRALALASGDPDACRTLAEELDREIEDRASRGTCDVFVEFSDHRLAALAHGFAGETEKAAARFDQAIGSNRKFGYLPDLAYSLRDKGKLLLQTGGVDEARECFTEAREIAGRCGMRPLSEDCTELLKRVGKNSGVAGKKAAPLPDGLTVREAEVAALLVEGLTNREIGERLSISDRTVANHVQNILNKTGSGNRAEAAAYAIRHGLTT
jgi:DNA-binding CsgD family transcriptional regulator